MPPPRRLANRHDRSHEAPRLDRRTVLGGLVAGAAMSLAAPCAPKTTGPARRWGAAQGIEVTSRPITHFERGRPEVSPLWRSGIPRRSGAEFASPHFGGWSGLVVEPDGSGLFAISDVGSWLSADIAYDGIRPFGLKRARIGPLLDGQGAPLRDKREQDAESVTLLDGTLARGTLLVGFERDHRIVRYPVQNREAKTPAGTLKLPAEARRMAKNQGIEALAVLKAGPHKGAVVAFAERLTFGSGYHTGWIWIGGEAQRFQLQDIDGFNITDAVGLPDGGLLVLERYFRWTEGVKMRLRRLSVADVAPGARATGRTLLQVDANHEIDNMEGIGLHRDAKGALVMTLISDDNFNHLLQRNLLLQFTLHSGPDRA